MLTSRPGGQILPLLTLRWRMSRQRRTRALLLLTSALLLLLMGSLIAAADSFPDEVSVTVIRLSTATFLGFAILTLVAPVQTGTSGELLPPDQLVAFPVTTRTRFLGSLLLAPVNLVWLLQLFALVTTAAVVAGRGPGLVLALALTALYVTYMTTVGQVLSWLVLGLQQRPWGRRALRSVLAAGLVGAVLLVRGGDIGARVDELPLDPVLVPLQLGTTGRYGTWLLLSLGLLMAVWAALRLGIRTCSWALSQGAQQGRAEQATVRRRAMSRSPLRQLVTVNRAGVWRSSALRRAALVLACVPALAVVSVGLPWRSLIVLPALIAAGSALLFGINAFCLDGGGALWLASAPRWSRTALAAKAVITAEVTAAAVVITLIAGAVRAPAAPTMTELVAVLGMAAASVAVVTAYSVRASIRRPHKADLVGPRDAPAPPLVMLGHSVRLSGLQVLSALLMTMSLYARTPVLPLVLSTLIVVLAGISLRGSFSRWSVPEQRARVVATVAAG